MINKYFKIISLLLLNSLYFYSYSQPAIQWQRSLGGTLEDDGTFIQQTLDGGYIVTGYSNSMDGDITTGCNNFDYWIVRLSSGGSIIWDKTYGGSSNDVSNCIRQTSDGGFIVAGYAESNDGNVTGNHGDADYWILKLDGLGIIQWKKSFGGTGIDLANSIRQTSDLGFIITGTTSSNDGDVIRNTGIAGLLPWILKLDWTGAIQWQKTIVASGASVTIQTSDGGYIFAGYSNYSDSGITGNHGGYDYLIVKLNSSGIFQWQKNLGGTADDFAYSIQQTNDGGYIIAGGSSSNDGDATVNLGIRDYWIVKLDSIGGIQWQKSYGGTGNDVANSIGLTSDGGYIVAGFTNSTDMDVTGNHGDFDYWVVKIDSAGGLQWQKSLGGMYYDNANSIQQTSDMGYIVGGYAESSDGDITGHHSSTDYWVVKLEPIVGINEIANSLSNFQIIPNPFSDKTMISFNLTFFQNINIEIHDLQGRLIKDINTEKIFSGKNKLSWDATNNSGNKVEAGIYFITVASDNFRQTSKIEVLKN